MVDSRRVGGNLIVDGTTLIMTRGDTEYLTINLTDNLGDNYILRSDDKLYFTVKRSNRDDEFIFQKVITGQIGNEFVYKIEPLDTKLESYGQYYYDIQITKYNGDTHTIIPKPNEDALFIIGGEITYE